MPSIFCTLDYNSQNSSAKEFFSGELLRGTVNLNVTKKKIVCGIYIFIDGIASVEYCRDNYLFKTKIQEEEHILHERNYLLGGNNGKH